MTRFPLMDAPPRMFTVEEANELVAALEIEFGRIARARGELAPAIEAVGGPDVATDVLQGDGEPPPGREAAFDRLRALADELTSAVARVNGFGCLVKDLELGLVDFHSMLDGEPVLLCWQFGEPAVAHFHGLGEGFAGRKPIEGVTVYPPAFLN